MVDNMLDKHGQIRELNLHVKQRLSVAKQIIWLPLTRSNQRLEKYATNVNQSNSNKYFC